MAMHNDLNSGTKTDLINYASAQDQTAYLCLGDTTAYDSPIRFYYYDASSVLTADGEDILDATGMGIGKFIKTKVDYNYLANKPSLSAVAFSGAYSDLTGKPTIPTIKRQETYSGTTNGSGNYTVSFGTSYSVAPNVQVTIPNQSGTNQYVRVSSVSTSGFTINAYSFNTNTILGLVTLGNTIANLSGISLDVLVTEK